MSTRGTVIARFEVKDFERWMAAFELHAERRSESGLVHSSIYRADASPNSVFAVFEWRTAEGAKRYIEDPQFKAKLMEAGVVGVPEVLLARKV